MSSTGHPGARLPHCSSALLLVPCTAGFGLQLRLALVVLAVFPLVVGATELQKRYLEAAHARAATQIAGAAVANLCMVVAAHGHVEAELAGHTLRREAQTRRLGPAWLD